MATTSSGGLQLGVFFDFDKGKAKGIKDVEEYMERLQQLINKKKLYFTGGIDPKFASYTDQYKNNIDEINKRIKDIRKEWNKLKGEGGIFDAGTGKLTDNARKLAQEYRELNALRKNSMLTVDELHKRIDKQMRDEQKRMQQLSGEYKKQGGYLQHLIQRMTVYASIGAVMGFLTKVREVTAEFELQRISLGAIIQDQNKANALFSEIKNFALKSPVKILDLTTYTKQLAAYRIETDKLFDTTKRLADISVGLGVDMQRIILFYGQVRAAGYLRASEVRQATEAGIPLVEELANKLSQARGELVTVGQVMDMISKRQISFQQVAEVFEDLTNKGGIFYNMQEKQGNTLYGMWQKLGDAAQVMYDQIGNTGSVNNALKSSINLLRQFMLAWRDVARGIEVAAIGYLAFRINSNVMGVFMNKTAAAVAASNQLAVAQLRLNTALSSGNKLLIWSNQLYVKAAQSAVISAKATGFFTTQLFKAKAAIQSLGATMIANAPMLAFTAIAAAWAWIDSAIEKANRLKKALDEVRESANIEISKSVQNFESLANAAVNARDGSKEQREALEELQTTYGKMIPAQDLQIEKLREMAGNYDLLTEAIRNNIAAQKMQEGITTVIENFAPKIKEAEDKIKEMFHAKGWGIEGFGLSNEQTDRIIDNAKRLIKQGKDYRDAWTEAFQMEGMALRANFWEERGNAAEKAMRGLADTLRDEKKELDAWESSMKSAYNNLGLFAPYIEEAKKNIENATFTSEKGTFEFEQERVNKTVEEYTNAIRKALEYKKSKISLDDFITVDETSPERLMAIDFEGLKKAIADEGGKLNVQVRDLVKVIQEEWAGLVPSDPVVYQVRNNLLKLAEGVNESIRNKLLRSLWDGSAGIDEHLKTLKGQIEQYEADLQRMKNAVKVGGFVGLLNQLKYGKQIEETEKLLELLREQFEFEEKYTVPKDKNKGGDTRLQTLQEINQTLEKISKEYNEMRKVEGDTQALERLKKDWQETLDYTNKIGKKFGLAFDFPTQFSSLQQYRQEILKVMKTLQNLKGGEKAILEFQTMISTTNFNEAQKQIEQKLKDLQDRISQSKTAKEFYDKILSATGDVDIAANVTMSIYGGTGEGIDAQMAKYIKEMFEGYDVEVPVDVIADNNQINYKALAEFVRKNEQALGGVDSKTYQELTKIAQQGQKDWAKTYEGYLKDLEKAKSYSDKRIELARKTANTIAEIQNDVNMPQSEKERLTKGYQEKEAKEAANLAYEAFKDSPMYVAMFEDLDYASTTMLDNMKQRLQSLQGEWKNLDPRNLKEMQKRLDEINKQLIQRNPFKTLSNAIKEYQELSKGGSYKDAEKNLADWEDKRKKAWDEYERQLKIDPKSDLTKAAKDLYDYTVKNANEAEKLMERWQRVKETIGLSVTELFKVMDMFGQTARGIADLTENFGGNEEDVQYWNDIADGLDAVSAGIQDIISSVLQGNVIGIVSSALTAIPKMIIGFTQIFDAGKIRKANKEIARQQKLLEQLEYTYSRLQKVQDKLFGSDYIQNYNQQLANLSATAEAYRKQAEAEKSKGKKADEDKIQDYENSWRDTMDEIKDMRDELTTYFAGTDITSAARDFANSWLEARWAFEDTTEAMREKFADMVQNMIVESMAAQIMQNLLQPIYDEINKATEDGKVTASEMAGIASLAYGSIDEMNNAMELMLTQLEQAGLDLSQMFGESGNELSGITRDYATASEESINGLAQGVNTQNFYLSYVPTINENVAAIRILMEGGAVAQVGGDYNTLQNEHLAQLPIIAANTLATAERCERAAIACEEMADNIRRVVVNKGGSFALNTRLN